MTDLKLGRLERIELRNIWLSEATSFTPWLASPENIALLGETLGIDLEVEAQEKSVGPFRADILCKDTGTDKWVLIENQLERTDHGHLGQLLTYASGLEAVTIVWIAAKFTEEHRSTLDWLNRITNESFRFFGLEVELWKIANSPAAPKFNIVAKPNNWSQSVARAARAIDETELSETRLLQRDYWSALNAVLDEKKGPVSGNKKPQAQSWMSYRIGRSGINLAGAISIPKKLIRAELYLGGAAAKLNFAQLQTQSAAIEKDLGYGLLWEELPQGQDSRISLSLNDVDPTDRSDWPKQHLWLAARLNDFHRVFFSRVAALQRPDGDGD
jgi:hypothetical protein